MKNVTFMDKNSPKIIHKGPFGAKNRIRASKFYENTFGLFSSKELKGFRRQQKVQQINLFDSVDPGYNFLENLYHNPKTSFNFYDAFGLRQNGWTLDRVLTRNRDIDFARTHGAEQASNNKYTTVLNQPRFTLKNLQTFLQADRVASEPEIINTLKTKSQLKDLGYEVFEEAKPMVVRNDLGYYDISSCLPTEANELFVGKGLDEFELDVVKQNNTEEFFNDLGKKLKVKFKFVEAQQPVLKYAGKRRFFANLAYKARRFFARINTGIRAPFKDAIVFTHANLTSTTDVAKTIDRLASSIVAEKYAQYEKFVAKNLQAKERFNQKKNATMFVNKNLLAESICRMGIFSKNDANILSKHFKLNAIRALNDVEDQSGDVLSDVAEIHSLCMRQVANALDVNLKEFAEISNIEFDENSDKTFDAVLSKASFVSADSRLLKARSLDENNNEEAEEEVVDLEETNKEEDEGAEIAKAFLRHFIEKQSAEQKLLPEGNPIVARNEEIVAGFQEHMEQKRLEEEKKAQLQQVLNNSNFVLQEKNQKDQVHSTAENNAEQEENYAQNMEKARAGLRMLFEGDFQQPKQEVLLLGKPKTNYVEQDDFGFAEVDLHQGEEFFRKRVKNKVLLIRAITERVIKPVMVDIMDETSDDLTGRKEDDLCAVIRKYRKMMAVNKLEGKARTDAADEIIKLIDAVERIGEDGKSRVESARKALNLYKLTIDLANDVIAYKQQTPALAETKGYAQAFKSYIAMQGGKEVYSGEVKELIKDEILKSTPYKKLELN